jgi:hypothetical protein
LRELCRETNNNVNFLVTSRRPLGSHDEFGLPPLDEYSVELSPLNLETPFVSSPDAVPKFILEPSSKHYEY